MSIAVLLGVVPVALAWVILRRFPRHPVGLLLAIHGAWTLASALAPPLDGRGGLVLDQLLAGGWILSFLPLALIAYLVPTGAFGSSFWRRWVLVGLICVLVFLIGAAGDASGFEGAHGGTAPPLRWLPEPVSGVLGVAGLVGSVALIFGGVPAIWARLRHSTHEVRIQLLWVVWGALTVPLTLLVGWVNHFALDDRATALFDAALALTGIVIPATLAIAVLRHHLFDIELVLSRTLTYVLLSAGALATYAGLLRLADATMDSRSLGGLLAVTLLAVVITPAHTWLSRAITRWVYGFRGEPHTALRLLADRVADVESPALIAALTTTVAEALRVECVWVEDTWSRRQDSPADPTVVHQVLRHRGTTVGRLAVQVPPGRTLGREDLALLRDLGQYSAVIVSADRLTSQLTESRGRIVISREEERRRLRRDLHDGLGPSLAAVVLKLNAAQSRPAAHERDLILGEARDEVKTAIAEVRRLVDDLRPPAIDEVGLVGAIRQRAESLSGPVSFEVTGPAALGPLPAAAEVAAFRICAEAMTNAARHSRATRCHVAVAVSESTNGADTLEITISDNGVGQPEGRLAGVGWTSMRERAAELGGTCAITTSPDVSGVVVVARIPLPNSLSSR